MQPYAIVERSPGHMKVVFPNAVSTRGPDASLSHSNGS